MNVVFPNVKTTWFSETPSDTDSEEPTSFAHVLYRFTWNDELDTARSIPETTTSFHTQAI
jgi:hypothetical protein